jgi:hypothetical protein
VTTTTTTPPPADPTTTGPLTPTDHRAFAFLGQVNGCLRQCLCTLARHGVALRGREPARARVLLDTIRPWPLYKGGQFLFDLMEWEDLMVDAAPPPPMPAERIISACSLPVQCLAAATAQPATATKLIPGQRTAAALDLPLRLLATTARAAFQAAAQDLTDLLATPAAQDETDPDAAPTPAPDTAPATDPEAAAGYSAVPATDADAADPDGTDPDAAGYSTVPATDADAAEGADDELPPLEAGFYLYEDIVLGALVVLGPLLAVHAPPTQPNASVSVP